MRLTIPTAATQTRSFRKNLFAPISSLTLLAPATIMDNKQVDRWKMHKLLAYTDPETAITPWRRVENSSWW